MIRKQFNNLLIIYLLLLSTIAAAQPSMAQNGTIAGKVIDQSTGETLIGANVMIKGTTNGAQSDMDGKYALTNLQPGIYDIVISYVSYQTKTITGVRVSDDKYTPLDIVLESTATETQEVTITAQASTQSSISLMTTIRNTPAMTTGISAEAIRRTPDKNVGEALKRVSGVTVQDNKFLVIRGLNDRYNNTLLNGLPINSWEPDRKSVSFDVFPSNFVDNLLISKTATPDLPAEFAGGIVQVNTREIPEENSFNVQVGSGMNSQTTGKPYQYTEGGDSKWYGSDDGTRALPSAFPSTTDYRNLNSYAPSTLEYARLFKNTWAIKEGSAAPANRNLQMGFTRHFKTFGKESGVLAAFTYNRSLKKDIDNPRRDYLHINDSIPEFTYTDERYTDNLLAGGMLNFGTKLDVNNKIYLKNTFTRVMDDQTILRDGYNRTLGTMIQANTSQLNYTHFAMSQIGGEHFIEARPLKINWSFSYATTFRNTPDLRRMFYTLGENYMTSQEGDSAYQAYVPTSSASNTFAGRFFSKLNEQTVNGKADIIIPIKKDFKNSIRAGFLKSVRNRSFIARVLGYKILDASQFFTQNPNLLFEDQSTLFDASNIGTSGFGIDEITNPSDAYTASSDINATYIMADHSILKKIRLIYGVRFENFTQELQSKSYSGKDISFTRTENKLYPSLNVVYALNEKQNLRAAYGRTTARPEFRELAPFSFYDFTESGTVKGNSELKNTFIDNIDLKYEIFPGSGQFIAVTAFYKHFSNPIEPLVNTSSSGGNRDYEFHNEEKATNYGLELDWRAGLNAITKNRILERLSFFGNISYVHSVISVTLDDGSVDSLTYERPLWGQSPYTVNLGISYQDNENGFGTTLVYNKTGDRIDRVGVKYGYTDRWEHVRPLLDFQVSKRIIKNGEIRFTVANIFDRAGIIYQDMNEEDKLFKKYDEGTDRILRSNQRGTDYSVSFNYRF
jgi:outer membrane receptor for ferrienterochelin and colicin